MLGKEKTILVHQLVPCPSPNRTVEQNPTKSGICCSKCLNAEGPQNTSESFSF